MRIEKIIFKNYRAFRSQEIKFRPQGNNDLHLFVAENGVGKTTLLNSINWCLYNDEPNLSDESSALPIVSTNELENAIEGDAVPVSVSLQVTDDSGRIIEFNREHIIQKGSDINNYTTKSMSFEVKRQLDDSEWGIYNDKDECQKLVDRFVPKNIREYFFFNSERLDNYFKSKDSIKQEVFEISKIELLNLLEEKRLGILLTEIRREASKINPLMQKVNQELEECQLKISQADDVIKELKKIRDSAWNGYEKYNENLAGKPDIEEFTQKETDLERKLKDLDTVRKELLQEHKDILLRYGMIIPLIPALNKMAEIINEKQKDGNLPPNINPQILIDMNDQNDCTICGNTLTTKSREFISELLKTIKITKGAGEVLLKSSDTVDRLIDYAAGFEEDMKKIADRIKRNEEELRNNQKELDDIFKILDKHKDEQIREWTKLRTQYKEAYDSCLEKLAIQESALANLEKEANNLKEKLSDEIKRVEKANNLRQQIDVCEAALKIVNQMRKNIISKIREKLQEVTQSYFLKLMWKKDFYNKILLNETYDLSVFHKSGLESTGSMSAAEKLMLALSFTLALHTISGFNSPMIIDNPVIRVTGQMKVNIGNALAEVSETKQIILLLITDEYSTNLSSIMDSKAASKYRLQMSEESNTKLEVI